MAFPMNKEYRTAPTQSRDSKVSPKFLSEEFLERSRKLTRSLRTPSPNGGSQLCANEWKDISPDNESSRPSMGKSPTSAMDGVAAQAPARSTRDASETTTNQLTGLQCGTGSADLRYGLVPADLMDRLSDSANWRVRAEAIEEMLALVSKPPRSGSRALDRADVRSLLLFLIRMFDDSNFKIKLTALQIVTQIVQQRGESTRCVMKLLLECLAKRLGDSKIVLRQAHMRLVIQIMESLGARVVLRDLLNMALPNKLWRVREEAVNIATAAMLTFPRSDLDLELCAAQLAPTLLDSKQRVRQASMEALAVLGHALGDGHTQPLVGCVSDLERQAMAPGILDALLSRLARRQLAQINKDGLVVHAVPASTPASTGNRMNTTDIDVQWIMAAGSTLGSCSRPMSSAVASSACATPTIPTTPILAGYMFRPDMPATPASTTTAPDFASTPMNRQGSITDSSGERVPRPRFSSAGRKQLPWDLPSHRSSNPPPSPASAKRDKTHSAPIMIDHMPFDDLHTKPTKPPPLKSRPSWTSDLAESTPTPAISPPSPPPPPANTRHSQTRPWRKFPSSNLSTSGEYSTRASRQEEHEDELGESSSFVPIRSRPSHIQLLEAQALRKEQERSLFSLGGLGGLDGLDSQTTATTAAAAAAAAPSWPPSKHQKPPAGPGRRKPPIAPGRRATSLQGSVAGTRTTTRPPITIPRGPISMEQTAQTLISDVVRQPMSDRASNSKTEQRFQRDSTAPPTSGRRADSARSKVAPFDFYPPELKDPLATLDSSGYSSANSQAIDSSSCSSTPFEYSSKSRPPVGESLPLPPNVIGRPKFSPSLMAKLTRFREQQVSRPAAESVEPEEGSDNTENDEEVFAEVDSWRVDTTSCASLTSHLADTDAYQDMSTTSLEIPITPLNYSPPRARASRTDNDSESGISHRTTAKFQTPTRKRGQLSMSMPNPGIQQSTQISPTSRMTNEEEEVEPLTNPSSALPKALKLMEDKDDWEKLCSGLHKIRSLACFHDDVLAPQLHVVTLAVIAAVKNLRSSVAKAAMHTIEDLFVGMGKQIDPDLDIAGQAILGRCGDTSTFLKDDAESAVRALVISGSPVRVAQLLANCGKTHRNAAIRRVASLACEWLLERLGAERAMRSREIMDLLLPTVVQFSSDATPDARYFARRCIALLLEGGDLIKVGKRSLNDTQRKRLDDAVTTVRTKGVGAIPSTHVRRNSNTCIRSLANSSGSSGLGSSLDAVQVSPTMRMSRSNSTDSIQVRPPAQPRVFKRVHSDSDATTAALPAIIPVPTRLIGDMTATDSKVREKSLTAFVDLCHRKPHVIVVHAVKLFDAFVPRISDANSKVGSQSLTCLLELVPYPSLTEVWSKVATALVPALVSTLVSRHANMRTSAHAALLKLVDIMDCGVMLPILCNISQFGNKAVKAQVLDLAADVFDIFHAEQAKNAVRYAQPVVWHCAALLVGKGMKGSVSLTQPLKLAIAKMVHIVYERVGDQLLSQAKQKTTPDEYTALNKLLQSPPPF